MSGLKSSWELSLERSDDLVPELKSKKKLTKKQKDETYKWNSLYFPNKHKIDCKVFFQDMIFDLSHMKKKLIN